MNESRDLPVPDDDRDPPEHAECACCRRTFDRVMVEMHEAREDLGLLCDECSEAYEVCLIGVSELCQSHPEHAPEWSDEDKWLEKAAMLNDENGEPHCIECFKLNT